MTIKPETSSIQDALRRRVVAVIPCYNVGPRLRETLAGVSRYIDRILLVDDGSTDGCTDGLDFSGMTRITLPENRGKGHALLRGVSEALQLPDVDAIVLIDADGQHDPGDLPALYDACTRLHADLVVGARQLDRSKTPWRSRFGNQVTAWVASRLFRCPLADTQCGYRVLSPTFAASFTAQVPGGRYETEMQMLLLAINQGRTLVSVPVKTIYEPGNRSSHFRKVRDSLRIYATLMRLLTKQISVPNQQSDFK